VRHHDVFTKINNGFIGRKYCPQINHGFATLTIINDNLQMIINPPKKKTWLLHIYCSKTSFNCSAKKPLEGVSGLETNYSNLKNIERQQTSCSGCVSISVIHTHAEDPSSTPTAGDKMRGVAHL